MQLRTAYVICLWIWHKSGGTDDVHQSLSSSRIGAGRKGTRTVNIRHRAAVRVLDEHIAQLELSTVEILPSYHEAHGHASPLGGAVRDDVSHL